MGGVPERKTRSCPPVKNGSFPRGSVPERAGYLENSRWCGREDSNLHGISPTSTSSLRVYQFRHDRMGQAGNRAPCVPAARGIPNRPIGRKGEAVTDPIEWRVSDSPVPYPE